jgi:hypothetical protein
MGENVWSTLIQAWLDKRKNSSLGLLSKLTDVPYPTLRRVLQGERRPSYATAAKLGFVLLDPEEAVVMLEKEYGKSAALARALVKGRAMPVTAEDGKSIEVLDDLIIYGMSLSKNGTTKDAVQSRLGLEGVKKLEKLLERGFLTELDRKILPQDEKRYLTDFRDVVNRSKLALDLHNEASIEKAGSFGYFGLGGLNEEGRDRIVAALSKVREEIAGIFNNPQFEGEMVLAVSLSSSIVSESTK